MSHTVQQNSGLCYPLRVTIVNYTNGGENFSLADLGALSFSGIVLGNVSPSNNSLGVLLIPILNGANLRLYQFVSGSPVEISTTSNLNAVIDAVFTQ